MSDIGVLGTGNTAANPLDARRQAAANANAADGQFDDVLGRAARGSGNAAATAAAPGVSARHGMADPARWAAAHGAPAGSPAVKSEAAEQLSDYLSMPLGKRMFYMMLASMGISKEQYDAMSPEDKAKVAQQIAQRLKDNAESQKQVAAHKDEPAVAI